MAELSMQVPVSLIEELGAADDANEGERFYAALRRLRALLSQPTPTAGVCTCPSGDGSLRWPCAVHPRETEPVLCEFGRCAGGDTPQHHTVECFTAEPPRIDDLAPEHSYEAMRTDIVSALAADGFSYLESEQLLRRFESTIRDVRPPA